MSWVRLDDNFPNHPKVVGLSDQAFRLYISGLCYASHYLTDGLIIEPAVGASTWASGNHIWTGIIGTLTEKDKKKANHKNISFSLEKTILFNI